MVYIVSYDLKEPTQRYDELVNAIKTYPDWACIGRSVYLIESNDTHVAIRDNLGRFVDGNDKLFVGHINAPAAWKGYSDTISEWVLAKLK